jgi:enterochelin esterase-like enzyme
MKTVLTFLALAASLCAQAAAPAERYQRVTVHGPTLVGNLGADTPDRPVSVWLPPGYEKNTKRRYPVLYLLHGFTDSDTRWFGREGEHFVNTPKAVDAAFAAGVKELIVVMPNAFTRFQGSMYGNSVVTGDWETFISRDLVAWVDSHYRTLATPASRGLAGHSMGGYGTLRVAMKAPGVFSSLYIMSPCCLQPGPPPEPEMFGVVARIRTAEEISAADFFTKAMLASAAAWSPNPKKPPLFIDLPVADGKLQPEILARWAANAPVILLHQHVPAVKTYRAIGLESGDKDPVAVEGSKRLHELLDGYSIAHVYEVYDGDHVNRIQERLTTKLLPFFSTRLAFQAP